MRCCARESHVCLGACECMCVYISGNHLLFCFFRPQTSADAQKKAEARNVSAGAFGLLWSLGADMALFEKVDPTPPGESFSRSASVGVHRAV